MIPDPARDLLTIAQACALLSVSRRTIYYWLEQGKLDTVRTIGGSLRIYKDSLFESGPHLPVPRFSPP